jgi:hypothetical protein
MNAENAPTRHTMTIVRTEQVNYAHVRVELSGAEPCTLVPPTGATRLDLTVPNREAPAFPIGARFTVTIEPDLAEPLP